jgi:amidohydrolase
MASTRDFLPFIDEIVAIRRDIHRHPELGMEEHRTAELVARQLEAWGVEVHRNVGGTGVVGVLRNGEGGGSIGLRADMDALPMTEESNLPFRSAIPGRMHGCGHDGHTAILLATARYLALTRRFSGTVVFIFQPGEEGCGGAEAMVADGLFERFPCDAIFALHNEPGLDVGRFRVGSGVIAAGGGFFDITVAGKGVHAAYPHNGIDPVLVACHLVTAMQSIVSREVDALDSAVLSITRISGADAYNTIATEATIAGTARFFRREVGEMIEKSMRRLAEGICAGMGASAKVNFRLLFAPTVNDDGQAAFAHQAAAAVSAPDRVSVPARPEMGSEDFSFMLEAVPGAYVILGNGPSMPLHHPGYAFDDASIPHGAAYFAELVERKLTV